MKIFISWSGPRSKALAQAIREWLPDVIQGIEPWMSAADIEAGARWSGRVSDELSVSRFGIICVTRLNQVAPWIMFEAGALAKSIADTYVCPYLLDFDPSQLSSGPLTQFQAKQADEAGTLELVRTINKASKEEALPDEKLDRAFVRWWPDLAAKIRDIPDETDDPPRRSQEEMLDEILLGVRDLRRALHQQQQLAEWAAKGYVPLHAAAQLEAADASIHRALDQWVDSIPEAKWFALAQAWRERLSRASQTPDDEGKAGKSGE